MLMHSNGFGLGSLPFLNNARTRSISAENPTGKKGEGGMAIPCLNDPSVPHSAYAIDLGQKWKVRPFLQPKAGETVVLMDVDGPGMIQHIWIVPALDLKDIGRAYILRFYWDNEENPSIEVPIGDFFAAGHDLIVSFDSAVVTVNPRSGLNCYWPMPFRKHARITFTNETEKDMNLLGYQITYQEMDIPDEAAYLHAQWRRAVTDRKNPDYILVDDIKGKGRYVGTFLAWSQLSEGWFGEGEVKFFIDGDDAFPTICGTGTEDYFCGSYGFPENYTRQYTGVTKHKIDRNGPTKWSLYRWHIMDPICFDKNLKVTIQALGWWPNGRYQPLQEDIASVVYWYQLEQHSRFPEFPPLFERWPR